MAESTPVTEEVLDSLKRKVAERLRDDVDVLRARPTRPLVFGTSSVVAYVPYDERTTAAVTREANNLRWAHHHGIPVPEVLVEEPDLLAVRRVARDVPRGQSYVSAVIAASDAIAAASLPASGSREGRRPGDAAARVQRGLRTVAYMIDPRVVLRDKKAYQQLPRTQTSHGDFHPRNVLFDASARTVCVIDWPDLGALPHGTDLTFMWTQLQERTDRDLVMAAILERMRNQEETATVLRWIALRSLVELVTDYGIRRAPRERVVHSRAVLEESAGWCRKIA